MYVITFVFFRLCIMVKVFGFRQCPFRNSKETGARSHNEKLWIEYFVYDIKNELSLFVLYSKNTINPTCIILITWKIKDSLRWYLYWIKTYYVFRSMLSLLVLSTDALQNTETNSPSLRWKDLEGDYKKRRRKDALKK